MSSSEDDNQLVSPDQAAELLHTTPTALAQMRDLGTGPEWGLLTRRTIRYRRADLEAWRTRTTPTRDDQTPDRKDQNR